MKDHAFKNWAGGFSRLLIILCVLGLACTEDPPPCTQDSDCGEGFRCDTSLNRGECIQEVQVVRCGETRCSYPAESCIDGRCISREGGAGGGTGGAGGIGGTAGTGAA
ncbi:MAG: hypothetical protein VYD19_09225, partial [Myxococcota bacterium]|nr:hypothetical protein [Myxococcota bacterium]